MLPSHLRPGPPSPISKSAKTTGTLPVRFRCHRQRWADVKLDEEREMFEKETWLWQKQYNYRPKFHGFQHLIGISRSCPYSAVYIPEAIPCSPQLHA